MATSIPGVYAITNKTTGKSYVGSTVDMARRERVHFRDLRKGVHRSVKLQRSWNKHGPDVFTFTVLELTSAEESPLRAAEQVWMDKLSAVSGGYNTNPVAGSVGRLPKSAEHKARIGAAHRGRKNTEEAIKRMSEAAKGRKSGPLSDACKAKISASNTGKVRTPEMRARISAARTGMKVGPSSPEHCAAISAGKRGKPLSEHHKQRIREGQIAARLKKEAANARQY